MITDSWLEAKLPSPRANKTVLILCRNRATAALVRRWIARRRGWIGVEVLTLRGLALQVHRAPLLGPAVVPDARLPDSNAISARIAGRPGLVANARRWVRKAREARLAGSDLNELPQWLVSLEQSGWADDGELASLHTLLESARRDPLQLNESMRYDVVVSIGFEEGGEALDPWTREALLAMTGATAGSNPPASHPIPARWAPDVTAEARMAVQMAMDRPEDTLVLVASQATARRMRDALHRNGICCGWEDAMAASSTALGSVVLRCAPWFQQPDPPLRARDLLHVFGFSGFGPGLQPPIARWFERETKQLGLSSASHLMPLSLSRLVLQARLLDAPLSQWLARCRQLALDDTRSDELRRSALALEARLRALQACNRGETFEQAFQDTDQAWDDFDALVYELLGEEASALGGRGPAPQTLGAMRSLFSGLRVRLHDDPAARTILASLHQRRDRASSLANAREALGVSIESGQVAQGVDILEYEHYDGRPSGTLILLDVHHQGIAARPTPDPLLTEDQQSGLGEMTGSQRVRHRMHQALRAVAQAEHAHAIVARRDAGGRALVAPIHLPLAFQSDALDVSYGLDVELPETRRRSALQTTHSGLPEPSASASPDLQHLARQACVEWVRAGRAPYPDGNPRVLPWSSHAGFVEGMGAIAPRWAQPWLGHAPTTPEAQLDLSEEWSVSRLFEPLTGCAYRAYATAVLSLSETRGLSEELEPREVGNAVHRALQTLGGHLVLRVPKEQLERARAHVVADLGRRTGEAFRDAIQPLKPLSEIRTEALRNQVRRWKQHWHSWARSRVRDQGMSPFAFAVDNFLKEHPATKAALLVLQERIPDALQRAPRRNWCSWLAFAATTDPGRLSALGNAALTRQQDRWSRVPESAADHLRDLIFNHGLLDPIRRVARDARLRWGSQTSTVVATALEVPFGSEGDPGELWDDNGHRPIHLGPTQVSLGQIQVRIRGQIDRVIVTRDGDRQLLEVLDYKTGRTPPETRYKTAQRVWQGKRIQPILYALALEARAHDADPALSASTVATVGFDRVRHTVKPDNWEQASQNSEGETLVDPDTLRHIAADLGRLVGAAASGHWPLLPDRDRCPKLSFNAPPCPFSDACRFRGLPPHERVSE